MISIYKYMILLRRNGLINMYTSITADYIQNEVGILTDPGRITRPILIVEDNKPIIDKYNFNSEMEWLRLVLGKSILTEKDETITLDD